ncbi:MAG: hypothetical protein JXQ87_10220 [Bacteroidia bacterium]
MKKFLTVILSCLTLSSFSQKKEVWGTTVGGGQESLGIIFKTDSAGNNYSVVKHFTSIRAVHPSFPPVVHSSGKIFGVAKGLDDNDLSTIYEYDNGKGREVHRFGTVSRGRKPLFLGDDPDASFIEAADSKLYGTTTTNAKFGKGCIYRFNTQTLEYKQLYHFKDSTGYQPKGELIEFEDGMFYGTTSKGGLNGYGTIFSYAPARDSFAILYHFNGMNGMNCEGGLLKYSDSLLIGTTKNGGNSSFDGPGLVFSLNIKTNKYEVLRYFSKRKSNTAFGFEPIGTPKIDENGFIYGVCEKDQFEDKSILYKFNPNSNDSIEFSDLSLDGLGKEITPPNNGKIYVSSANEGLYQVEIKTMKMSKLFDNGNETYVTPSGGLRLDSNRLLGVNFYGGKFRNGSLFEYDITKRISKSLLSFGGTYAGGRPRCKLVKVNDELYGLSDKVFDYGFVIYKINTNNGELAPVYWSNGVANGTEPISFIKASNGKLYGVTRKGGSENEGVIFEFNPTNEKYTVVANIGESTTGLNPIGSLLELSDGKLYGTCYNGSLNGGGVIFSFNPSNKKVERLNDLHLLPYSGFIRAYNGTLLGIATKPPGSDENIWLYKFDVDRKKVIDSLDLSQFSISGQNFLLQTSNEKIIGVSRLGGNGYGTIYEYDIQNNTIINLHNFDNLFGCNPVGEISELSEGIICGNARGIDSDGAFYTYDFENNSLTVRQKVDSTLGRFSAYGPTVINYLPTGVTKTIDDQNFEISIYPSVFNAVLNIESSNITNNNLIVTIMTLNGSIVYDMNHNLGKDSTISLLISDLKKGPYIIQLKDSGGSKIHNQLIFKE